VLMTTDALLVRRAARGDRDAFETVYAESFRCVYAFAVRATAGRVAAEAATEAILARAFQEIGNYTGEVPFAAWLHGIARRTLASAAPASGSSPSAPSSAGRR